MPVPAGYKLDQSTSTPKLPPGYALDSVPAEVTAAASPDFTTNSIDPATATATATGKGYGLYAMQGPNGPVSVPFNRVQDALTQGLKLARATAMRYRDDLAATQPSWFQRVTEPSEMNPNTTPEDSSWGANRDAAWNAAANAMGVGGNVVKRAARTVAGGVKFPFQAAGLMVDAFSQDPETSARAEEGLLNMHPGAQIADRIKEFGQDWQKSPALAGENLGGDALGMYLTGKLAEGVVKAPGAIKDTAEGTVRRLAGSGPGVARDLVRKAVDANEKIDTANVEDQRAYNRKIGETARQNREATAAERAKADQSAHLQVGGSQLIYGLNQLDKALRAKAGVMFDGVRELVAKSKQPPLPGTELGTAARAALTKISGSSAVPKPFSDILAKYPESDPEFIEDPTKGINSLGKVGKDSPYYELLKQRFGGGAGAPPVTFGDLQGYYTETGAELAKGTLPGDVYTATKELHNSIGDMMQKMAKNAGPEANKMFWDSRVFYRGYMDTFHEPTGPSSSGSPVAQALQAKDPLVAVEKFTGKSGNRGVADLRRYSDSLANLAQDVQQRAQADITVPAKKTMTSASPLKLKPHQTISEADLRRANEDSVRQQGTGVVGRLLRTSLTWPLWRMLSDITRGRAVSPGSLAALPAAGATGMAIEEILAHPDVNEFLTRPSRAQIAQIPLELRGQMPEIVAVAKSRGMQVSPLLIAYAAAMQRNKTGQAQQQAPPAQGVQQ